MKRLLASVAALVLGSVTAPSSGLRAETPTRPNIIFILADDLGYTDVATFGSKYYETPHINQMAAQGVKFTQGYSCGPNCQPTRAALMSGQYGPRTGVYTVGGIDRFPWQTRSLRPVDNVVNLPLEKVTLAQTLKNAGYATAMFGKWHLGNGEAYHPSKRGFDEAIVSNGRHINFDTNPKVDVPKDAYLADFLTDRAVDFIQRHKEGPFFLYLPHYGVHSPYEAKADLIARFKDKPAVGGHHSPVYAAMLASVDESVGRILKLLDDLKLSENTLVVFSSDNGGVGGYEREGIEGKGITDNAPLRGGKGMLYEGGVRVPYVFQWKEHIKAGQVNTTPINSVDLYPTLVELAGAKAPAVAEQPLDGVSYVNELIQPGAAPRGRDAIFWHFPGYLGAGGDTWRTTPGGSIRQGDWKLIEFFEDGRRELYNLQQDPGEKTNLAAQEPDRVKALHERLEAWRKDVKAPLPTANTPQTAKAAGKKGGKKKGKGDADAD
ncbi:sulfatase [Verrucomicrobium sp. BvORR034]|uniref:sulfatase n=1 Tax=Verrucomicrobium sp. BvORR034 TaxID=1396418 RepID=UPI000679D3C3|nr:sulfatase [Verrucomicrobium sp. BvORR034]